MSKREPRPKPVPVVGLPAAETMTVRVEEARVADLVIESLRCADPMVAALLSSGATVTHVRTCRDGCYVLCGDPIHTHTVTFTFNLNRG